jgi:hypothetical protein
VNTEQKPKQKSVYEDRPFWASCFPPRDSSSKSAFVGVIALEDGKRYWIHLYHRESRNGVYYMAVHLEPKEG